MSILARRILQLSTTKSTKFATTTTTNRIRTLSGFSFAGPQKLEEVMKMELMEDKSKAEVSDIWMTYHENKKGVRGGFLNGKEGVAVLERAEKTPFFIQPIFRDDGFFMLLSQFQSPSHFLLAYLEDYKMDPNRAQPLMTFSIFNDLVESHDISLVRCDVINKGIEESEGQKVMDMLLDSYRVDEDFSRWVKHFNEQPEKFDADDYISCMNQKWKGDGDVSSSGGDETKQS